MVSSLPGSVSLNRALSSAIEGDGVLLCGDAVYAAQLQCLGTLYVLDEDALARGVVSQYPAVSYDELVQLVIAHDKQIQWG